MLERAFWGSVIRPQWEDISHSIMCAGNVCMLLREVLWAPFNLTNLNWATPDTIGGAQDGVGTVSVGVVSWQSGKLLVALLSRVNELGVGTREGSMCELCGCWCEELGSRTSLPGLVARSRSPGQASHSSKRPG